MTEREKFEVWAEENGSFDNVMASCEWSAWLACAAEKDKELAALQARVKELEGALEMQPTQTRVVWKDGIDLDVPLPPSQRKLEVLSITTPDQALQRALLDARIEGIELVKPYCTEAAMTEVQKELRAQRAELTGYTLLRSPG